MPQHIFLLDEAARYLHVEVTRLEKWVKRQEIPFESQGANRIVFQRDELDAWASQRILNMQGKPLAEYHEQASARTRKYMNGQTPLVCGLLSAGCVAPALRAHTKPSLLRAMVALAESANLLFDSKDFLKSIEEREALCSTGLPGGLALLHPRYHDAYLASDSFLIIGRALHPLPFGAPDGKATDLFFLLCCLDDRLHLHALARLCTLCQTTDLLNHLRAADDAQAMSDAACACEDEVVRRMNHGA
ncbi:MAG: PTS sugar transporter subunit IIA [bacterium]